MSSSEIIEVRDLRQQDWVWASKAVLFNEEIDGNTFKTYCGLGSYADNRTQESFPSVTTLGKRLGIGRTTIIKCLQTLEELGFISVQRTEGRPNVYCLLRIVGDKPARVPKLPAAEPKAVAQNWVKEMLEWAEKQQQAKFVNYGKQIGAIGAMARAGYTADEVKACYTLMRADQFWRTRGFDFTNVMNVIPTKINSIRQKNESAFAHLVSK